MLPLKDDNPTQRFPILTVVLIVVNLLIFGYQSTKSAATEFTSREDFATSQVGLICTYGLIPDRAIDGHADSSDPGDRLCAEENAQYPRATGLVTHQFVHGSWLHVLGNMLFLWVFGNNVEDRLGRIRFLPFFLICGIIAALGQALPDPGSAAPLIGASGAISGVLGAYFLLFPKARVLTLVGFIPVRLPAWIVLGLYLVFQFLYVANEAQQAADGGGGVAYWAHIVGFVAGLALIRPFLAGRRVRPADTPMF